MKRKLTAILLASVLAGALLAGCGTGNTGSGTQSAENAAEAVTDAAQAGGTAAENAAQADTAAAIKTDAELAAECAALIDAIYVQERTDTTDADIAAAKAAWDALTDVQKALVEGEFADPDYFGLDTGDASADDPLNADEIGENELLVVSFGTSFNDSRATDIGGIEKALQEANPDWSVRRAFTSQIIINHVQARDGEVIDNIDQALARAKDNGVKNLVIQPTHLMHGAEYDELMASVIEAASDFETVRIAEPLLGEVGEDATIINEDKETVAKAVVAQAVEDGGFESLDAAEEDGTAFVFMGHGTAHVAKVTYSQMQTQMDKLGYDNVFVGTVEGEPAETACDQVIAKVKEAGYKKVVLRPLMVVAGDHANNDMAGEDADSWKSMFEADGSFESIDCQIAGLGRIEDVEAVYADHTAAAMDAEPLDPEAIKKNQEAADACSALIEALNVQERTDKTDDDIKAAKDAWDALTDEQKALVEDPDYFGRDTGNASQDNPLNGDKIGENELLVVSFGTSFNDSRATDIGGIEKALQAANPDWSVRRAFTSQIIINHIQARDGEVIDNVDQALARAKENGVKNLVIQPTHLMHGAEYDELTAAVDAVKDDFETVTIAEPLLGEVGEDAAVINEDKEAVSKAVVAEAVSEAGFDSIEAAEEDGTAFVFMGHGTAHVASVTYSQMQTQMDELGYKNVFIGTVEGEPAETACDQVIAKVKEAGYKKVVLRPLMVVAGDHANNDMAGEDEDSWKSMFEADGSFESIDCQIAGLGRIEDVEAVYAAHTEAAIKAYEEAAAANCAALIDKIYVQERTDTTDEDIEAARAAWDALTDEQKEMVAGEYADPDYFGLDTGDASKDDPLNDDNIGENELLVVSFGTSFNESRATDIGGIEKALQKAYPDWSVRRAFTAQIIINHVQARDGEVIDNIDQALARAKENGVKNLVIQPTHLMHGAEYDELTAAVDAVKGDFEKVTIAEPLLGEVGEDASVINEDKETVAKAVVAEAVKDAGFGEPEDAEKDGVAFVFMGHGTAHVAKVTYSQMQTQMDKLGYKNVFIGTVEGEPEETACDKIIAKVKEAGYKKVVLRPLMVVAGDHANNDMAGDEDDSWKSMFEADGSFESIETQIEGLGRIPEVQDLYVAHTKDAIEGKSTEEDSAAAATDSTAAAAAADTSAAAATDTTAAAAEGDTAAAAATDTTAAAAATDSTAAAAAGGTAEDAKAAAAEPTEEDKKLAAECAALIDAIYVQERTDTTDDDIKAAKEAWDALTDTQKALVEGEFADPDYFGKDTGDASADDALNSDEIGENELLVVSFGTSFNDSRATDIGGIEKALQEAYPDWSVRRAFTAQIIINHVQARDGEVIDNVEQALARAKENGVKNLVIQPTHLMHGAEYDELAATVDAVKSDFETVTIAEPLLGEVGEDASAINEDKETVAKAVVEEAVEVAGFDSLEAAEKDGTAFVFMGHGTAHVASVTYSQMQTQMNELGYKNVFIGTVEGEPEETACENVIAKVKEAGYKKVILRPLMVVAGDHANNDMAGDDEDSWKSMFTADGSFESIDTQIAGLGRIPEVQDLYVDHAGAVIDTMSVSASDSAEASTEAGTEESGEESSSEEASEAPTLEDGTYIATFTTDSSMFHVNEANDSKGTLTVENGQMTIHVTLVSKKILNLYQGTAEEAQQEGAVLLKPTTDEVTYSDGETEEVYGFDIPVPVIGEEFDCAIIGEKGKWYDHKVMVSDPVKE